MEDHNRGRLALKMRSPIAPGLLLAIAGATIASAQPLKFTVTGGLFGSGPAIFILASNPVPSQYGPVGFGLNDVPVSYDGTTTDYNLGFGGSSFPFFEYAIPGSADYGLGSTSLFSGSPSAPTFQIGDYTFEDMRTASTLAVDVSAAVEPSTWLLMIAGITGLGLMLRRTRKAAESLLTDSFGPGASLAALQAGLSRIVRGAPTRFAVERYRSDRSCSATFQRAPRRMLADRNCA